MFKGIGVMGGERRILEQGRAARRLEDLGYHSLWVGEFHNSDGFVRMAVAAMGTTTLRIHGGIINAFNRAPAMIAAASADIDELSGGRLTLGLGTGTRGMQERWYGIEYKPPAPRAEELIRLLKALWRGHSGGRFTFSGRFYNVDIDTYGRPNILREDIPVFLAGVNKRMVRAAATVADGLVGHPIYSQRWLKEAVLPSVEDGLRRSGRSRDQFTIASEIITSVSDDRAEAMRAAKQQIGFYTSTRTYQPILELSGLGGIVDDLKVAVAGGDFARLAALIPDEFAEEVAVIGTASECREQMKRYDGLVDLPVLYPPAFGLSAEGAVRMREAMLEAFAPAKAGVAG